MEEVEFARNTKNQLERGEKIYSAQLDLEFANSICSLSLSIIDLSRERCRSRVLVENYIVCLCNFQIPFRDSRNIFADQYEAFRLSESSRIQKVERRQRVALFGI